MSTTIGIAGEAIAKHYLEEQGLTYVTSNYRCKLGEIDLIFRDNEQWVFVEVKNRKNAAFGNPVESVNQTKQQKIICAAQHYMLSQRLPHTTAMRFDVMGMINLNAESIIWLPNAFISH